MPILKGEDDATVPPPPDELNVSVKTASAGKVCIFPGSKVSLSLLLLFNFTLLISDYSNLFQSFFYSFIYPQLSSILITHYPFSKINFQ